MSSKHPKVDAFVKSEKKWKEEVQLLRQIALDSGLTEDFKWSLPCYLHDDKNIAIVQNFKNSCAFMFFQGSELKDSKKLLKSPGENSQSAKRFEFASVADITKVKAAIRAYIKEAIKISESSVKTEKKPAKMPAMPAELKQALDKNKKLKAAFEKLTPGRQRLYLIHIASAKQAATRVSRVEKCVPRILQGLGLSDRP
ncbi:YdeI/OmpD-associated family protein [Bdellovibrio bacteriovorus]|uniref:YdeI/OmpD-associated family protein n=1 Tax=Bdellovibrio bacteriovorus TaxID=959 RepID=UPI003AA84C4A